MRLSEWVCSNRLLFYLVKPVKLAQLSGWIDPNASLRILDVGCGNHSAMYFRTQFPRGCYTGTDRSVYNNIPQDIASMDKFLQIDLEHSDLAEIPDASFDLIVLSHVLEHLHTGRAVLLRTVSKLRYGGLIYVSHPHAESVHFPSRKGLLNFYDDPTHVSLFRPGEVAQVLRSNGCEILENGRTRTARNLMLMPLKILSARCSHHGEGPALWDLYRFEEYTIGRRNPSNFGASGRECSGRESSRPVTRKALGILKAPITPAPNHEDY